MGFDVSYHPISPAQIANWYIESLASDEHAAAICDQAGMHELYKQKFMDYLPRFRETVGSGRSFDKTHGYYIAVTQGFFGRFHYVRGAMLSQLGDVMLPYTSPWSEVLPELVQNMRCDSRIVENYSSGVYVPPAQVGRLLVDATSDSTVKAALAQEFPGEHFNILITALREAEQQSLGLLEATEVIEPNPTDLESTHCVANLFNCDTAGPLLYQKTVQEQFASMGMTPEVLADDVERMNVTVDADTGEVTMGPSPTRTGPADEGVTDAGAADDEDPGGGFFSRFRRTK